MRGKSEFKSMTIITYISIILGVLLLGVPGYSDDATLSLDIDLVNDTIYTTITMHGQLLVSSIPKEGVKIGIHADDQDSNHIFADEVTTGVNGHYTTFFKLENTQIGTYEVFASASSTQVSGASASSYFTIGDCTENWTCSDWSACTTDNKQTCTCTDNNHCGTDNDKPASTRDCTPTCAELGGQICTTSQSCDGSFVDASDTSRCCESTCSTSSSSSSGSGSSTTASSDEPEDEPIPKEDPVQDIPDTGEPVIEPDVEPVNETGNISSTDTHTDETTSAPNQINDDTPTGGVISFLAQSRWAIVNTLLIMLILFFALRISRAGNSKEHAPGKYSYSPKTQKRGLATCISNLASIAQFSDAALLHNRHGSGSKDNTGIRKIKVMVPGDD